MDLSTVISPRYYVKDVARMMVTAADGTYCALTGERLHLTSGYTVGRMDGIASRYATNDTESGIESWLERFDVQGYDSPMIGIWTDEYGARWLDAVEVFPSRLQAMLAGNSRGEMAIWDNARQRAIECM